MYLGKKVFHLFPIIFFIFSCSTNQHRNASDFRALSDILTISNSRLKTKNDSLYKILYQKLQDEKTTQSTKLWYPKAMYLQYRTDEIIKYIDTTIANIQAESVIRDTDSVYEKLNFYKGDILRIDPDIYAAINKNAEIITHEFDSVKQKESERFNMYLFNRSKDEKLFILNQTLYNIKSIENQILIFCDNHTN